MTELSPIQVRVLGCLLEKKETTPEQYPLTLNALRVACNQKTSREPVTSYTEGEVGRTVRELIGLGLVREEWGARVSRYDHQAGKAWNLHSPGLALMATLMLRGPQTLGELRTHAHRLHAFSDLDDVQFALGKLMERDPPLAAALPRQRGQKEGRYAHLLCGEPDLPVVDRHALQPVAASAAPELEARVADLECRLAEFEARLEQLEGPVETRRERD
jgi:uncharacterized protein